MTNPDSDGTDPAYCELPTPKEQRTPSTRSSAPLKIRIDAERGRFVAEVAGAEAFIQYRYGGADILHLIRTWVPPEARGGGIGALLAEFALEHAREEELKVTTSCWFIDQFLDASPQYQDLRAG